MKTARLLAASLLAVALPTAALPGATSAHAAAPRPRPGHARTASVGPVLRGDAGGLATISAAERALNAAKDRQVATRTYARTVTTSRVAVRPATVTLPDGRRVLRSMATVQLRTRLPLVQATPGGNITLTKHQPQQTSYWCGPTSAAMDLTGFGVWMSQATVAQRIGTTTDGSDSSVMVPALNTILAERGNSYRITRVPVGTAPTAADLAAFKTRVMAAVDSGHGVIQGIRLSGAEIASNPTRIPPGYAAVFPSGLSHFVLITGYRQQGTYLTILDPAGANSIWGNRIPASYEVRATDALWMAGTGVYAW